MGNNTKKPVSGWLKLALAILVADLGVFFFAGQMSVRSSALGQTIKRHEEITEQLCATACDLCSRSKTLHNQVEENKANFKHLFLMNADLKDKIGKRYTAIGMMTEVFNIQITMLRNETLTKIRGFRLDIDSIGVDIDSVKNWERDLRTNINLPSSL